ncbi:hypothetical protein AAFC00_000275 [Neodothiora populina]|uniref:Uncharacterized protein n=1 Tax=Neodothiora populina TaxID=2781224 RepID=A0ABR3PCJ9_9PEZI
MASTTAPQPLQQPHTKLPNLPKNAKVTKRPLLHPAIPSKYAGPDSAQKVVYISSRTPFMSAIKRVERLLDQVEKRETQSAAALVRNDNRLKRKRGQFPSAGTDGEEAGEIGEVAKRLAEMKKVKIDTSGGVARAEEEQWRKEEVVVKATGKAIQKALSVGLWFQRRDGFGILIRTGSVAAIDDVEVAEEEQARENDGAETDQLMKDAREEEPQQEPIPETRIRYASTIEIAVHKT